ncbi:MAG TPA: TIGR00366 family protein [Micropepsaceae bacterium]|jgi:short-chain fatty acids transporter|nr:TIGR00366 family protein [Micropepsaceae bacterium]
MSANPPLTRRRSFTAVSVDVFERWMPDAFVLAIALTAVVAAAAAIFAPQGTLTTILTGWYAGIFNILGFAFQMILILVSGHALAYSPPVQRGLKRVVARIATPNQAVVVTFLVAAAASWINWGFGLVIGAVLAREVAKQIRVDFAWLVAAAYSGFVIYDSGPSGSIPLSQASPGNALNIVEKVTGHILPYGQSIFTTLNLVPTLLVLLVMPFVLVMVRPRAENEQVFMPVPESAPPLKTAQASFARRVENSPVASLFLVAAGIAYVVAAFVAGRLIFDANMVIFLFLIAGLALHGSPLNFADAIKGGAKQTGSMILQYPIYGGIMGIMTATGLAAEISQSIAASASAYTLPVFSFLSSIFISLVIPSGGGHWAVQGPFTIPAATTLGASVSATTMAVAMGEQVANMLQPFWALPVVAIAGIGIQRVLGFTILTFVVATTIYGAALLILV